MEILKHSSLFNVNLRSGQDICFLFCLVTLLNLSEMFEDKLHLGVQDLGHKVS